MILLLVLLIDGTLLQAVSPESLVWGELAKQGVLLLMMGVIIWWQNKDFTRRETEYKATILRQESEYKLTIAKREEEIKALYEVQSKEYKVQLEMLARNADIMKQVRVLVEAGTIKNADMDTVKNRQIDTHKLLFEVLERLKNLPL